MADKHNLTKKQLQAQAGLDPTDATYIKLTLVNVHKWSEKIHSWKVGIDAILGERDALPQDKWIRGLTFLFKYMRYVDRGEDFGFADGDDDVSIVNECSNDVIDGRREVKVVGRGDEPPTRFE